MIETLLILLIAAVVLLGCAVLVLFSWLNTLRHVNATLVGRAADHDLCVALITRRVSSEHAAVVLHRAADKWDTVDNAKNLERLRREFKPGEQSVAAAWLREEAESWAIR